MKTSIDWDKIDEKVKPLVRELNGAGLKTMYSCHGHQEKLPNGKWSKLESRAYINIKLRKNSLVQCENNTLTIRWTIPK